MSGPVTTMTMMNSNADKRMTEVSEKYQKDSLSEIFVHVHEDSSDGNY